MDLDGPLTLTKILTEEELKEVSSSVQEKFKAYIDKFFDEYCKEKAAASRLERCEQRNEELQSQIEDYAAKLENFEKNVAELRKQLDKVAEERARLLDAANINEKEVASLRDEKNNLAKERDGLLKIIDRQNSELERLNLDLGTYQQQLKAAINAKCEAIARVDEIESKEVSLEFKEKRMEQERNILQSQIQQLTEDLHKNVSELQNVRSENTFQTMHIEARLNEKLEELKIVQTQNGQYKETIERMSQNIQELSTKLLNQNEEANTMMDFYKRELEAKTKLADLYKRNCDDNNTERNELEQAITELKRMLNDASSQYGELETQMKAINLKHEEELEEKEKAINLLKTEIAHANELLKEAQHESVESAISKMAPSAAIASRLIRSDMSLTELYSLYVKSTEDLEHQKRENSRLSLQMKTILQELTENAPVIKKQEIEYEKLIESNHILSQQRDELLAKKSSYEEHIENLQLKINHMDRENKKLKHSQTDLSRQVCFLLKEVEQLRIGLIADQENMHSDSIMATTDDVISKKLVTFDSIAELQENNQKLLLLVRDLSGKLEESEIANKDFNETLLNDKLESYSKKLKNMQETLNKQNNTVATLVSKCERYKKMYFEQQRTLTKNVNECISDNDDDETNDSTGNIVMKNLSRSEKKSSDDVLQRRVRDLEKQVNEAKDQYKTLKEQYEYYTQEKKNNEKILNEQFDTMRTELRELTSSNCKLLSTVEYNKEQIKLQQRNINTYKQQIAALEDRNKNYENTIFKHEQTVNYLRDEIMKSQRSQTSAEAEANHLRHENRILKDSAARLQSEKDSFHREQSNQALLLNNLEFIKTNLERSEIEGRSRLEQRLDDTVRELSAQRRRFQEEENRFIQTTNDLKRQTDTAKKLMEDEKQQAEKLRSEVIALRQEVVSKANQVDELSKKLQESLTPSMNDNPIMLANKKAREFELKLEECKIEISSLSNELLKAQEHGEQYYKMSQSAESEIKKLHDVHSAFVSKAEAEIQSLKRNELNLKARIGELEAEVQIGSITEQSNSNQCDQIKHVQEELKEALQKLSDCNRNLRTLRSENSDLAESLNAVETKYANEMIMHSADIQELTKIKAESSKLHGQLDQLQSQRDQAVSAYDELKRTHEESIRLLQQEKEEMEKRIDNLNNLNSNLHDQIEGLSTKLSLLTQSNSANNTSFSGSDSLMETSSTTTHELNQLQGEDESKQNEQLLQIIKFLRKEKDLSVAKLDILKAENARLLSEHTILQKKIDEVNGFLNQERAKSDANIMSATKHEEILRKIETLNAITDSNRILREERNALSSRVKELNERISKMEEDLFPMQNRNRELLSKVDELSTENTSLRTEAIKWRQRANLLVEKSNKNPEEFKRLQAEREQLAKMLSSEKEINKQITDELNVVKARVENEIPALEKQIQVLTDEKKKFAEELSNIKQNNTRMLQEVMELKVKLLQKEDMLQKCTEDIDSKEVQLQDSKSKEMQIRKIAKRYKDSYLELLNKSPNTVTDTTKDSGASDMSTNSEGLSSQLQQHRATIESLNSVIRTMQEENDKLRKDYDDLKAAAEMDEQTKTLLRDARSKIVSLTESKNVINQELVSTKNKLQSIMQSSENHEAIVNDIKSQYEESLSRMEKEMLEQTNLNKETIARLGRENESLLMRINQLSRQLGHQQSSKPSTSSVAITEKGLTESSPRTANVKPMSGSASVQQSATVTPWRGSETPLASIRPISVQNSRTAAILPTSQQTSAGSSSTSSTSTATSNTSSSAGNTALVPPQQVHTTGSSSLESMSSSPTSSHTDYMPSTSSASINVAAIPPMGSASTVAESSQEAESLQHQQSESTVFASGGQQVVALVSPRVEASQNTTSPVMQLQQEPLNQQPSTSGTTSSTSHIAVSTHSRHTPSSSSVTTSQAGSSVGHKRPRDQEGDTSTSTDDCVPEMVLKQSKRLRTPMHTGETGSNIGDMGIDVDQVPTSSQRDQEDDIVVVDSDDEDVIGEVDDGPADVDAEHEVYEDSYEQDHEMDDNECPEINEGSFRAVEEVDNNEVDVDEGTENQAQCAATNQEEAISYDANANTSKSDITEEQDNNQQSQTITSGSCEPNPSASTGNWKQATSSTHTHRNESASEIVDSSPHGSKFVYTESSDSLLEKPRNEEEVVNENIVRDAIVSGEEFNSKTSEQISKDGKSVESEQIDDNNVEETEELDDDYADDPVPSLEGGDNVDIESHQSGSATQSDIQLSQVDPTSEEMDGNDGVSSEGEKQTVEDIEEEGREAEASTSPTITTRSKTTRGSAHTRRPNRGMARGGNSRPTPIVWQDSPGTSRSSNSGNSSPNQIRGYPNQRSQRGRRMRRPGGNFPNMRFT